MIRQSRRQFISAALAAAGLCRLSQAADADQPTEVPWLDEVQRVPRRLPADAPKLSPLLLDSEGRKIDTLAGWKKRRAEIRRTWLEFLGTLRVERRRPRLEVLEEDRPEGCIRQLVRYESEPGIAVEGYLLRPARRRGRCPGVVAMHSTVPYTIRQPAGLQGDSEKFFGVKLAQRGYAAFCPRCFLWQGESSYRDHVAAFEQRHPGVRGMAKMLFDATRAVDVLESLPEVNRHRLGAVGHSLGAKEALYLAAFDERVKVTVSSEGGIGTKFSNWDAPWYLGDSIREFGREHYELLALVAPRAFLLLGGESADGDRSWPFVAGVLPVYALYGGPRHVGLFNHRRGHNVPPEAERRIYEWFATYL